MQIGPYHITNPLALANINIAAAKRYRAGQRSVSNPANNAAQVAMSA